MDKSTQESSSIFSSIKEAILEIKRGGMVVMVDDENRENEGDIIVAAEDICPEKINFMSKEARGLICLSLHEKIIHRLKLPMMEDRSKSGAQLDTAFTVSVEAKEGVTTGISAQDRAHTIRVAIDDSSKPEDLVVPGHIFPLKARTGGVLERAGHTEGSVDLMRLAHKKPAAVICEILKDDGTMARLPDLSIFCKKYQIPLISIKDLIEFRLSEEILIKKIGSRKIKTSFGDFEGIWFKSVLDNCIHFALVKGQEAFDLSLVDVRVHKQRPIYDVFSDGLRNEYDSSPLNSRQLIDYGLKMLKNSKTAAMIYLQDTEGFEFTSSANMDSRTYGIGAQIIKELGIKKMCIHLVSDKQLVALEGFGITVKETKLVK